MRTSLGRKLAPAAGCLMVSLLVVCSASEPRVTGTGRATAPKITTSGRGKAARATLQSAYGRLPLHFEPNMGQFDRQVRYASHGGGYTLFLTDAGAVMVLSGSGRGRSSSQLPQADLLHGREAPQSVEQAVVRLKLAGARQPARWEALEKQPGTSNYFLGNDPKKWRTDVPNYGRVQARGIYPGVDFVCYGNQSQLEYDLAVEPGADPGQVQLVWEGADSLRLNPEGDLVLATRLGEFVQKRPRVYQDEGGRRVEVESRYVLASGNRVQFEVARYDRHRRLMIDPLVLVYSTYLGGSGEDLGNGIAVDAAGSAYVTGSTASIDFATQSPYQASLKGTNNVFVSKLAPAGDALVYSTYLGGSGDTQGDGDLAIGIAVDAAGSAYVTGYTTSIDFPTQSPYQASLKGTTNVFVTKLAPAGNALVYSTYLGGNSDEVGFGIAVDALGFAYVDGWTSSTNFPIQSPYQATLKGSANAFVTKLAPTGDALVYSTYLGGSGKEGDYGSGIAVDTTGAVYAAGQTSSTDFPTQSPFQTTLKGSANGFVTKLAPAGNALVYSTYLGGSGSDRANAIAVDATGSAYVTGYTNSVNFPTKSPYQAALRGSSGSSNAFVTKLAPAGNALVYSTYLGGSGSIGDFGYGIKVDAAGSAYVVGWTSSTDFPIQSAYQSTNQGGEYDAFVTKLAPAGNALVYSTYLGGSGGDHGNAIAVDAAGSAYVTGYTTSIDFPTELALQSTYQGGSVDAFVAKFGANQAPGPWSQQEELTEADGKDGDNLGYSVSVSGNTAVVGAYHKAVNSNQDQGAAYVFVESGGRWSQAAKLTASDGAADDYFGWSVSVSGNTAVVGAIGNMGKGAAYVFVENNGIWSQQAKLTASDGAGGDWFGMSVSVSGNTVLVGASGKTVNGNPLQGAAYAFVESGGIWSQQAKLTASDGAAHCDFGYSVSLNGNTGLIGSWGVNSAQGAAYVFIENDGTWSQQGKLTASDGVEGDYFGISVSLSGAAAMVGAYHKEVNSSLYQGAAYVFVESGSTWSERAELTAADGAAGDGFGYSVSLSGNAAILGAPTKTVSGSGNRGAAYAFLGSGGTWSQQSEMGAYDGAANNYLGSSVSASGSTAVVGAYGTAIWGEPNEGAAYVFAGPTSTGTPASQTIDFERLGNFGLGQSAQFSLSATASSGLPVSFAVVNEFPERLVPREVCRVSGEIVTLVAVGQCTIQASQAGNADYLPAPPVEQSFLVMLGRQNIDFGPLANHALGAPAFAVEASASSGLRVNFASTTQNVCTVSASRMGMALVKLAAAGQCTIRASQPGNADYAAATPVEQSFQVTQ